MYLSESVAERFGALLEPVLEVRQAAVHCLIHGFMFFHLFYVFIWLVVWGQQNFLFVQIDILINLEAQKYGRYGIICLNEHSLQLYIQMLEDML